MNTPLPPEEPTGQNPPDGAILDYYLGAKATNVTLEILDKKGTKINQFSSNDREEALDSTKMQHPTYWKRPFLSLSKDKGHQRFVWNLRYQNPRGANRGYAIAVVQYNTENGPVGPYVTPGAYIIRLTVDGDVIERNINVKIDPRSQLSDEALTMQTNLSLLCYSSFKALQEIREAIDKKLATESEKKELLLKFRGEGFPNNGDVIYGSIYESKLANETVVDLQSKLLYLLNVLQNADVKPTAKTEEAVRLLNKRVTEMKDIWNSISN